MSQIRSRRTLMLLILSLVVLSTTTAQSRAAIEAAGVTDVYGDATGQFDSLFEWASLGVGMVRENGRGFFLTFHAGPAMLASIEFRQPLTRVERTVRLGLIPRVGVDIQLDESEAGDIYIGASLAMEIHPAHDLGYYLFVRADGWLNTFGGNQHKDVVCITVPVGIGLTFPMRGDAVR